MNHLVLVSEIAKKSTHLCETSCRYCSLFLTEFMFMQDRITFLGNLCLILRSVSAPQLPLETNQAEFKIRIKIFS